MRNVVLLLGLLLLGTGPAWGLNLRVGAGAGCTHPDLQSALDAIAAVGGSHSIRINSGTWAVPDGMRYAPTAVQGTVSVQGGYANCSATTPQTGGVSTFDGSGGLPRSVLAFLSYGYTTSFQLRGIVLRGGDALSTDARYNHGGGLAVYGGGSILLGAGTRIEYNAAGSGGGVSLVGSDTYSAAVLTRPDLIIDEGARIGNNEAAESGGGIACLGASELDPVLRSRHGSIIHRDGSISNNRAGQTGTAIYCRGSYAGGGYRPQPRPGAIAAVIGNSGFPGQTLGPVCAVDATVDLALAPNAQGERIYGAANGSNGVLLVAANRGARDAGLCYHGGWTTRGGASPAPTEPIRAVLQNVWFTGNVVSKRSEGSSQFPDAGSSALRVFGEFLSLTLRPALAGNRCAGEDPCVLFENNDYDADADWGPWVSAHVIVTSGALAVEQAAFLDNRANKALVHFDAGSYTQRSSVVSGNTVTGTESVLYWVGDYQAPKLDLQHNTVTGNSHERFFRIDGSGLVDSRGNVLHAPGTRLLRFGTAPGGNLRLINCNYLTTTTDSGYDNAVKVNHVTTTGVISFGTDFTPPFALVDKCPVPVNSAPPNPGPIVDYRGRAFGYDYGVPNPDRPADLGAVELGPADSIFADGFDPD